MDSKGVFNIELFISLILLLIIFSMIMSFSIEEFSSIEETQNRKESRIIVTELTDLMMDVYIKGDGFLFGEFGNKLHDLKIIFNNIDQ